MAKTATAAELGVDAVAPTARHALYLLYVLAVFVLTLEAKIDPAFVTAVGGLVGRNLWIGLPYNGVAGHWSSASFGLRPGDEFADRSGLFAFLPTYILITSYLLSTYLLTIYVIL
jgi:hypothetical protein